MKEKTKQKEKSAKIKQKPKENCEQKPENKGDYYYDDAHGYEIYVEDSDEIEEPKVN